MRSTVMVILAAARLGVPALQRAAPPTVARQRRRPRLLTVRHLNRLFLDREECGGGSVELAADDRRAAHVREIVWQKRPPPADCTLRVGVLDGGVEDCRASLSADGGVVLEVPPGLAAAEAPRPRLDVVLALPAPLRLKRVLPVLSSLGVDKLWLVGSAKTEKAYFGANVLKDLPKRQPHQRTVEPEAVKAGALRDLLVEGAEQSGDPALPKVALCRSLRACLPRVDGDALRLAAHPDRGAGFEALDDATGARVPIPRASRLRDIVAAGGGAAAGRRAVLAVGPDRGWEEPQELELFREHGFQLVTLGERTLRTDVALVSLVSLVHDELAAARGP